MQRIYQWPPEHHDAIRRIFTLKGRNALKTALSNMRDQKQRLKKKNLYMGDENWKKMQKKWEAPDWQEKSKGGKAAKTSAEGRGKPRTPVAPSPQRSTGLERYTCRS